MIRLSKKPLNKKDSFDELYSQDGFIHIAGMKFKVSGKLACYLDGSPNGSHSNSVKHLEKSLYRKTNTTLQTEAGKHEGCLGSGYFPEFNSKANLLGFARFLQDLLGY